MTVTIPTNARLRFGGVLRSEWIKLVTLRSTVSVSYTHLTLPTNREV